jgi:PAS domain S-box-containing protein
MITQKNRLPVTLPVLVFFLVIIITAVIVGIIYINSHKKNLLEEEKNELSSISYLKIREISQWRLERINDGTFLGENTLLVEKFAEYLKHPDNPLLRKNILQSLKSLAENFDYKNALLIKNDGEVSLVYPGSDTLIGSHLKPLLPEIVRQRKVVITDIHRADFVSFIHLDLVVPLIDHSKNDTLVLGLLTLRIDPKKVLYPILQSWPTLSESAEAFLFRKDGDSIVYLNELRYQKNSTLAFRQPAGSASLPAALAVSGLTGTTDGIDYRNVPVVAAMNKVPGTPWYLVAKIDRQEVLSSLGSRIKLIVIILILIILSSGSILALIIRNQRAGFYRKKYEDELERQALVKHFDYILKFANDIILLVDSSMRIVEANDRALEYYQYTREEFIGMKVENIRAPQTMAVLAQNISEVNENESATFETIHRRKDNSTFPIELSARIVMIEGQKYYQSIGRDITERKRVEATLIESEERFRKIFEESPVSIIMTGKDMGILRTNPAFCNLIGYTEEELKSLTFRDITHPDFIPNDEVSLLRLMAGEIPIYQTEKKYIRKDKTEIWGSVTVVLIRNNKSEIQFFLVMIEDITSRKRAAAELDNSLSLLMATLESTEDGLLVVDLSGKIVQYNQKFIEMWRIPEEIISLRDDKLALDFVGSQLVDPSLFFKNVEMLYDETDSTSSDLIYFIDGRIFERYSQPQKIDSKSVGRVWSFRDITSKKKAEAELIAEKERAEESDRLKTAFLHNVSHEIRTPMNAIIGFSTLLNDPELKEEDRKQFTDIIFQSSGQLLSIINDIVDIANVESGQAKVNNSRINLNSTLRSLNEQFSILGKTNLTSITLVTELQDSDSEVITDSTKLLQVFSNLINNAVKFTRGGVIEFGYRVSGEFLEFHVKDTGIGIPAEYHSKIFERFYQVDSKVSRKYSGTGLGLSICKGYVELLGGNIGVESEPGKGTLFIFTVPYIKG